MKINSIDNVQFTQKEKPAQKVWAPRTYYIDGTTVTLTAEEEKLYRTSLKQSWQILGKWVFGGAAAAFCAGLAVTRKLIPAEVLAFAGAFAGACGALVVLFKSECNQYTRLPYDKLYIENGLARRNLAAMNKGVKNEN